MLAAAARRRTALVRDSAPTVKEKKYGETIRWYRTGKSTVSSTRSMAPYGIMALYKFRIIIIIIIIIFFLPCRYVPEGV